MISVRDLFQIIMHNKYDWISKNVFHIMSIALLVNFIRETIKKLITNRDFSKADFSNAQTVLHISGTIIGIFSAVLCP